MGTLKGSHTLPRRAPPGQSAPIVARMDAHLYARAVGAPAMILDDPTASLGAEDRARVTDVVATAAVQGAAV